MNDPHVKALIYHINHGDTIDYSKAQPLEWKEPEIRLTVEDRNVRFEFKEHFGTEEQAREAIENYIRNWEFDATLKFGNPNSFRLKFVNAEIIDRNPLPGRVRIGGKLEIGGLGSSKLIVSVSEYPSPPSDIALSPEVETMYQRYMGYRQKREPLPGMAYFCLSMLEDPPVVSTQNRSIRNKRKVAAMKYRIDENVLDKIGQLSSTRGGADARKREGTGKSLSSEEHNFLDRAIKAIIRRVAEWEHIPSKNLSELSWSDLPPLDDGAPAKA